MRVLTFFVAILLLSGCVSSGKGWKNFYHDKDMGDYVMPYSGSTKLYRRSERSADADQDEHYRNGFMLTGSISVTTRSDSLESEESISELLALGKTLQADEITIGTEEQEVIGTRTKGSVYSSGNFSGSTSLDIKRTWTVLFFRKGNPETIGMKYRVLTPDESRQLGTNSGVVVRLVRRTQPCSLSGMEVPPAFKADILEGDIITELNGKKVTSDDYFRDMLRLASFNDPFSKEKLSLTIYRNGKILHKELVLRSLYLP